ncbi:hypothetical protein, variant 1 [Phytophthora nicotianae CJ01A1]|uniref:6-pyruvoyltetrahydropterin synthase n=6 Tax=Phytophthora nicotianae TaxID=4792 RepID=W2ZB33_PHYNI|nr:hypothetical protein, variant 1 [Phytophthora nicotianae]ETP16435.1 hypothetical protein, variant 1 [Phytophthora nicotianae CJ01A1]ETP44478.1 hypothetical protein, variant 1 [Phytophthora nicotianae P10297]
MGKELAVDRAPAMKTRGEADGIVKCCYLDKENTENYRTKPFERVKPPIQQCNGAGGPAIDYTKQKVTDVPMIATVPPHPVAVGFNQLVKVHVSKDYMKFNAAHFIAFKGFREKLHGHNYRLAVTITGQVGSDGYVVDFGEIKRISRVICKDLNESFIVPMKSDALKISCDGKNIQIITEDMAAFRYECVFDCMAYLTSLSYHSLPVSRRLTAHCYLLYTRQQRSSPFTSVTNLWPRSRWMLS